MTADFDQHTFEIDTYGFTLVERVLNADQVSALRDALVIAHEKYGKPSMHRGAAGHVRNLVTRDRAFWPVIDHPKVLPLIEHYLGDTCILASLNARIVRPGDETQGLHGDVPPHWRKPGKPLMLNTVWMLDAFTPEVGATRIVPGSHRSEHEHPPDDREIKFVHHACAPAGSVLIFNGQCWHGGGANTTNHPRHALFGHYREGWWSRFQVDPHENFPAEWWAQLNERQKKLLRMTNGVGMPHGADSYETK